MENVGIKPAASVVRPGAFGAIAALALLGFYLGIITIAQGWGHAVEQLGEDLPSSTPS
jgi:hypothetical protein